jgi:putative transferase (TIGR04331 family)
MHAQSKKIKNKPAIILTANAHWGNEVFKVWTAERIQDNSKLIISDHGGSFPPQFDYFNHDESIAEKKVTWFKATHKKQICLPPSKLSSFNIKSQKKYCSIIGFDLHRYASRVTAYPFVEQNLICLENTLVFCNALDRKIFMETIVKPNPDHRGLGWETGLRYSDALGKDKIFAEEDYYSILKKSKLVVCTYSDTTFSEALASGLPTILVHRPEYFEKIVEAKKLMDTMEEAKIIFTDPKRAAQHINKVWNYLDEWWNEPNVIEAKDLFFATALRIQNDWLGEWSDFLSRELEKK